MTSVHLESTTSAVRQAAAAEGLKLDDAQLAVLPLLARAASAALSGDGLEGASLYLWGPPGRGKTWLLDAFYESVPLAEKRRLHFHDFFRELHARTFEGYGRKGYAQQSAFAAGLDALLGNSRLLCFDEFHVSGPADAAFATRLLHQVLDRGIILVATSNYAPEQLLPDPMFHHLFEPGIQLLTTRLQVAALAGGRDYRTGRPRSTSGFAAGHHLREGDPAALEAAGLLPPSKEEAAVLTPGPVPLKAERASDGQIWFTFAELCGARSAAADYLALARDYRHWVVSGVPDTTHEAPSAWQRFGNLVDVLYDAGCRLDVLGLSDYRGRFPGAAHEIDLARSSSRFGMLREIT